MDEKECPFTLPDLELSYSAVGKLMAINPGKKKPCSKERCELWEGGCSFRSLAIDLRTAVHKI